MSLRFDAHLDLHGCKVQRGDGASLRVDALGRWSTARIDGALLRRTLAGEVVRVTGPDAPCVIEADDVHARIAALAAEFAAQLPAAALDLSADPSRRGARAVIDHMEAATTWSPARYAAEAARFAEVYPEAVEILPPDRYGDLVILPALGCPNSECSFCAFYADRRFRIMSDAEFTAHLEAVCALMGSAADARQGLFLGSASALSLGQRLLLARLGQLTARLGTRPRGIGAFWDPDHCPPRTVAEWQALRECGLTSAYLGLETGDAALRESLGKSAALEALLDKVRLAKEAGVHLGVMVLAGVAALGQLDRHVEHTAAAIEAMGLSAADLVFVSPVLGARPAAQLESEATRLRAALSARTAAKVAPYAADRFRHYA